MSMIIPMWENILIEPIAEEAVTNTGIILPDTGKDRPWTGKVIAVWCGKTLEDGTCQKVDLEIWDTVFFTKYSADEFDIEISGIKKKISYSKIFKYSSQKIKR